MTKKGFTLIELLIVIAIIGVLASVTLISLSSARTKAVDIRILSNVRSLRSMFESDLLNGLYADLAPKDGVLQIAKISDTAPSVSNILQLIQDIGNLNANNNTATLSGENVDLFTDGNTIIVGGQSGFKDTGVVIFTSDLTGGMGDYAIYATTTAGYVCIDSYGKTLKAGEGTIPGQFITSVPLQNGKVACI